MLRSRALVTLGALVFGVSLLSGCAGIHAGNPVVGLVFTDVNAPTANNVGNGGRVGKTGTAMCTEILGIVAQGDCSVATAAKNGGITQISTVDHHSFSVLGIYATYTTKVGGN